MLPFEVLGWLTSRIVYALGYLQAAALFTRFQIREFYADARAAQMAGTSAVIRLLDKLHLHNEFWFTAGKYTLQPEPKPAMFDYIHSYLSSIPEGARKRLRIVMKRHMSRVEATHPPTIDRIDFIDGLSDANDLPEIPIIYMLNLSQNEVRRPCTGSSSGYALLKRLQFCAHLLDLAPTHFLGSSAYSRAEMTA
jgi:hypothetical protein